MTYRFFFIRGIKKAASTFQQDKICRQSSQMRGRQFQQGGSLQQWSAAALLLLIEEQTPKLGAPRP